MEITIKINGQAVSVEVSTEVYEYLYKATVGQKIYPTKSVGTGIFESLTSTSLILSISFPPGYNAVQVPVLLL